MFLLAYNLGTVLEAQRSNDPWITKFILNKITLRVTSQFREHLIQLPYCLSPFELKGYLIRQQYIFFVDYPFMVLAYFVNKLYIVLYYRLYSRFVQLCYIFYLTKSYTYLHVLVCRLCACNNTNWSVDVFMCVCVLHMYLLLVKSQVANC